MHFSHWPRRIPLVADRSLVGKKVELAEARGMTAVQAKRRGERRGILSCGKSGEGRTRLLYLAELRLAD